MILELLPIGRSPGRCAGVWNLLPFFGLAASAAGAALSAFQFGHHADGTPGAMRAANVPSITLVFGIYYVASIGLAFALEDQRAFCKYLCPSSVILGLTSRLPLLKMATDRQLCNVCGACPQICPMGIEVAQFAALGRRVS